MISSSPIKKEIKDLNLQQLKNKKAQILNFLIDFPQGKRNNQGWRTLSVIEELIEVKENTKDKFTENTIKALFFED